MFDEFKDNNIDEKKVKKKIIIKKNVCPNCCIELNNYDYDNILLCEKCNDSFCNSCMASENTGNLYMQESDHKPSLLEILF